MHAVRTLLDPCAACFRRSRPKLASVYCCTPSQVRTSTADTRTPGTTFFFGKHELLFTTTWIKEKPSAVWGGLEKLQFSRFKEDMRGSYLENDLCLKAPTALTHSVMVKLIHSQMFNILSRCSRSVGLDKMKTGVCCMKAVPVNASSSNLHLSADTSRTPSPLCLYVFLHHTTRSVRRTLLTNTDALCTIWYLWGFWGGICRTDKAAEQMKKEINIWKGHTRWTVSTEPTLGWSRLRAFCRLFRMQFLS